MVGSEALRVNSMAATTLAIGFAIYSGDGLGNHYYAPDLTAIGQERGELELTATP